MRDAARQLADDLHLLALRELGFQRLLLGRVDDVEDRRLARHAGGRERAHVDAGDVIALGADRDLDGGKAGAARHRALEAGLDGGAHLRPGGAAQGLDRGHAGAARPVEHHARERGIGRADAPVGAEDGDAERRRLEEARKARLRGVALELGALGGEIEHGDGKALAARHGARKQAHRHDAAVLAHEVDVEARRLRAAGAADEAGDEPAAVAGNDVGERQAVFQTPSAACGRSSAPAWR